ncbi:MAG: sodium:proton antiporter [Spirochaetes bacterium]|nr:sodium:proton antiporter [Spirochaetota bacterium]
MKKTNILDVVSRKLSPFILLFGVYLVTFGHISPGGGFQGGVALASGLLLILLAQGPDVLSRTFPLLKISIMELIGYGLFLIAGMGGFLLGSGFLAPLLPPPGTIFILNVVIGAKVGAGITLICWHLFQEEKE